MICFVDIHAFFHLPFVCLQESSLLELKALAHLCPAIEHLMLDGLKMSAPCLGTLDMLPLTVWKVTEMSAQKCKLELQEFESEAHYGNYSMRKLINTVCSG